MKFVGHMKDIVIVRCGEFSFNILKNNENKLMVLMVTIRYTICTVYIQCAAPHFIRLARKLEDLLALKHTKRHKN